MKNYSDNIFDSLFPSGLFGYSLRYIFLRPHIIIKEIGLRIKWAYQRVVRGWDDRAVWSIDVWLSEMLPPMIHKLRTGKNGVPFIFLPDYVDGKEFSNYQIEISSRIYLEQLKMLAKGIEDIGKISDPVPDGVDFKEEHERRQKNFEETMRLFTKLMFTLWD